MTKAAELTTAQFEQAVEAAVAYMLDKNIRSVFIPRAADGGEPLVLILEMAAKAKKER